MEIQDRLFSETSGEKYYSVLMNEEEYSLYTNRFLGAIERSLKILKKEFDPNELRHIVGGAPIARKKPTEVVKLVGQKKIPTGTRPPKKRISEDHAALLRVSRLQQPN